MALLAAVLAGTVGGAKLDAALRLDRTRPPVERPKAYYLALGDSIAFGLQPLKFDSAAPASIYHSGYVDLFARRLHAIEPSIAVVNYGCPGETTTSFIHGPCPWKKDGYKLHDEFAGTQLQAALSFLRAHPGAVSPITLNLWGNDATALSDACHGSTACVRRRLPAALGQFEARLGQILQALHRAAPQAEIIVTGDWNGDPATFAQTDQLWRTLDAAIAHTAAARGARFADMFPIFNPKRGKAAERAAICSLTLACAAGDPHPSVKGYKAIARAVYDASGYATPAPSH